jgi:hypothetical protein
MKFKYLILLLFIGLNKLAFSQSTDCDPSHNGVEIRSGNSTLAPIVSSMPVGGTVFFKFELSNQGGELTCVIPVNKMRVRISFPRNPDPLVLVPYRYNGPITFDTDLFTWTYNATQKVLEGFNRFPISVVGEASPYPWEDVVYVPVMGMAAGSASSPFNIAALGGVTNNTANDVSTIALTVVSATGGPLPVKLESIDGSGDKCNAQLRWKTTYELNLKNFEVEVSKDGISFDKAGTVNPASDVSAGSYQFNTTQSSGVNYYRLKIVEKDGSFVYSKVIPISTNCSDKIVKVFPNPVKADQLLSVNISGYKASVKGDLYSSTGQFVKSYVLKNGSNTLSVDNLAQGFYTLRIVDNGTDSETFKINVLK